MSDAQKQIIDFLTTPDNPEEQPPETFYIKYRHVFNYVGLIIVLMIFLMMIYGFFKLIWMIPEPYFWFVIFALSFSLIENISKAIFGILRGL